MLNPLAQALATPPSRAPSAIQTHGGGSSEGRGESERRGRADADEVSDGLDDGDGGEPDEESVSVQVHDHGVEAVEGLWDDDGGGERGEMLGEVAAAVEGAVGAEMDAARCVAAAVERGDELSAGGGESGDGGHRARRAGFFLRVVLAGGWKTSRKRSSSSWGSCRS